MKFSIQRLKGSHIFESEHLSHDLRGKSIRGGGITMGSQAILFGINLIRSVILARLLTPEDFGLIGMVAVFVSFAVMFKDAGLSMATIQRANISEAQISSLFWCNVALSMGLGLLICALAPVVSLFYGHRELTMITVALSGSFIFSGFQIQHQALLRRHMLFGSIAVVNIVSNGIALIVAVVLALRGGRYWALVAASWVQAISALLLTAYFCPWYPKRFRRDVGLTSMLTFGGHMTGFNLLNFFSRNLDYILIGRFIGVEALGIYQRAYSLMMQPLQNLNGPLSTVGIPALSRLQNEPERYRNFFLHAGHLLLVITMPLAAFFIVMSSEIILVLFGEQWKEAIKPFMYLSLCIIRQPLGNISGWLFISQGRSREMMVWGVISCSITLGSIAMGVLWGISGVAACYSISGILFLPLLFWFVGRKGCVTTADLGSLFARKSILFLGYILLLAPSRLLLIKLGLTDWWVLFIIGVVFVMSLGGVLFFSADVAGLMKKLKK